MPEEDSEDEYGTTDPNYRWKGLATVMALVIGLGFPAMAALHAFGAVDITTVPQWAWVPIVSGWVGVLVYAIGQDVRKAWKGEI